MTVNTPSLARRTENSPPANSGRESPSNAPRRDVTPRFCRAMALSVALLLALSSSTRAQTCFCQIGSVAAATGKSAHSVNGVFYTTSRPEIDMAQNPDPNANSLCWPAFVSFNGQPNQECGDPVCGMGNLPDLAPGQAAATVSCLGCTPIDAGGCAANSTQLGASVSISFVVDSVPPKVSLAHAPDNGTIIGILRPVVITGSLTSYSPSTVTIDSVGNQYYGPIYDLVPGLSALVAAPSGGSWQISVDTMTLVSLANTPALTDNTGLTTLGVVAGDIMGNMVTYTSNQQYGANVDPTLARTVYIDTIPPNVSFALAPTPGFPNQANYAPVVTNAGAVTAITGISGTAADNLGLGSLSITIQDATSQLYWVERSSAFVSASPVAIPVTINSGAGNKLSPWNYAGISDDYMPAGHSYAVNAIANDYAGNTSTTSLTFSLDAEKLTDAANGNVPTQSPGAVKFTDPTFTIQYSATPTRVGAFTTSLIYCGDWIQGTPNPGYVPVSENQTLGTQPQGISIQKVTSAGCDVAIQISADTSQCSANDAVLIMSNGQTVGRLPGSILIPTDFSAVPTIDFYHWDSYFPPLFSAGTWWAQTLIGPAKMDLTGQKFGELTTELPLSIAGVTYPTCHPNGYLETGNGTFPDNMAACDPYALTSGPNRFCDRFSQNSQPYPRKSFLQSGLPNYGLLGNGGLSCGDLVQQTYYVNSCFFPMPPTYIYNQILLYAPNIVKVIRTLK
jgi:hypothetical protein